MNYFHPFEILALLPAPLISTLCLKIFFVHRQYSTTLKKLYIDINKVVCVQFKLKQPAAGNINSSKENLMLRALPVYSAPEFLQEPVCRCPVHVMTDRSNGESKLNFVHLVSCFLECDPSVRRLEFEGV